MAGQVGGALRFGTDGVRGVANVDLTPEAVVALGRAVARVVAGAAPGTDTPAGAGGPGPAGGPGLAGAGLAGGPGPGERWCLVGRDTRRSGPLLSAALSAGLAAEGVTVVDLGVIPTPGVSALAAAYGVPGAVISASHNSFEDNGIKLFDAGGHKLNDATEAGIEAEHASILSSDRRCPAPAGAGVGTILADPEALGWYRRQLVGSLEGRRLGGLRVVVDCAHGAAVVTAADVLASAGAEVVEVVGGAPDGTNINSGCGSTAPETLAAAVVAHRADAGLAFDGDADRVIAVDGAGGVVDGDRLLALFATDLARRGRLAEGTVVVTVMTNLGFHHAMAAAGVTVHQTPVGDRHVAGALSTHRWSLGGEQSGHIIFGDLAATGDGVLSGLLVLDLVARSGQTLRALAAAAMTRLPQVLRNVAVGGGGDGARLDRATPVWDAVRSVEAELGGRGRVLLRPSG
ncbi:MAG: phosphoglucosamine mutase, partial [Acidimicrobiales bacterium]